MQAVREVGVAEAEPGLVAEGAQPLDQREAIALQAEAALGIDAARERVGHDVEIGRDVDAVEEAVVSCIDDDRQRLQRDELHDAA